MSSARDATVLITGGTGSFGQKMTRWLLDHGVGSVRILSRDEAKQHHMRLAFDDVRLDFRLGDIRDPASVERAMRGVDHVFHAAALKQVPSCEFFPIEAVRTNILGSAHVIAAARDNAVQSVVALSTDKAVHPVNAMGMTKALMEKVVHAAVREDENDTVVSTVRYGNVMYSRGSVIPMFVRQIIEGQPLTVTDPEMTRFLLPLEQAVALVDYAFGAAEPGDTFVRKASAATVGDLAAAVLRVFDADNPIEVIGTRHGEKLYETLATAEELATAVDEGDYWRLRIDGRDLNYKQFYSEGRTPDQRVAEDFHSHNAERLSVDDTAELLLSLPEVRTALEQRVIQ